MEVVRPREFVSDLDRALDVATQGFGSVWVSATPQLLGRVPDRVLDAADLDRGPLSRRRPEHDRDVQLVP